MTGRFVKRVFLLLFVAFAALPLQAYAQDAVLTGTVTDATVVCCPASPSPRFNEATGNRSSP